MVAPGPDRAAVQAFFEADAGNWDAIYEGRDVFSVIHQLRRDICLGWAAELESGAALEVGCGTGLTSISLARLGNTVTGTDSASAMLERAEANSARAGTAGQTAFRWADVHRLPFADASFDLVVALGVVPWLENASAALREMARVLVPGGALIVNCDNRHRLPVLIDPRYTPLLAGARRRLRRRPLTSSTSEAADTVRHAPAEFDTLLAGCGLAVERRRSFGFGPFTLLGSPVLPGQAGVVVHGFLQRLADAGVPPLRATGAQYIVLARRL